jgi:hypothetical protein
MSNIFIKKPLFRQGAYCVIIADGPSPLAEEIEVIVCSSRESAWKTYKQQMKEKT